MAAPKNNEYYKNRTKDGRELIYETPYDLLNKAYEYFKWREENPLYKNEVLKGGSLAGTTVSVEIKRPLTIIGFCVYSGISRKTFDNYGKRKDFFPVCTHIRDIIEGDQLEGAMINNYDPRIVARLLCLVDKHEVEGKGNGFTINVTSKNTKQDLDKLKDKIGKKE